MNISQLECFISLAGTLNFVQTAEQLGLTQPAVSKQIKSMEDELGASLFNRTSRSVSLTAIGQQFLPEATDMLKIYYHAKEWISSYYTGQRNTIRIGYSDPHAINIISKILRELMKTDYSENIIPEFIQDQTDANLSRLQKSQLDVMVGMKDSKFDDIQITFKKLEENSFKCVVSKEHPLASKITSVTTKELWPYRQIIAIPPYLLKKFFSRGYHILPVNDNLDNIICKNINEAYGLMLAGIGYTLVPEHLVIEHPDLLALDWVESPHSPFGIYYRTDTYRKSTSYAFVNCALNLF